MVLHFILLNPLASWLSTSDENRDITLKRYLIPYALDNTSTEPRPLLGSQGSATSVYTQTTMAAQQIPTITLNTGIKMPAVGLG